ncbi:PP_RS20740 family protein [Xanthomonas campestris]|uniref:PP_RS20740 family protein n=1 Tax=Xanthomonas campestris TaxID=339 RepID=UPI002378A451|nr:hypothetical protein [Xanthomonas campestris]WDK32711.1 hypothetical protein JH307_05695 [Xanthomonas campestris]
MHSESNGSDGFLTELYQEEPEHLSSAPKVEFKPWHKPRKHWVRKNQWQSESVALIDLLGLASKGRPLTYVSLPGPDLLDVRAIHEVCLEKEIPLQFLGFMSGSPADEIELNISNDEVMRLPNVDARSSILLEDFESLADASSVGFTRFQGVGSFDVVNIDLCHSFGVHAPEGNETYYKAIHRIIDSQRSRRPPNEPWIMFLTTRANLATVNVDAKGQFLDCLIANVQSHSSVRDIVNQSLCLTEQDLLELRGGNKSVENFEEVFAAAVGKWLLKLMGTGAPQGTIELLPTSCTYGIRSPKSKDMLSLGFIFKTNISSPVDPTNLSSASTGNVAIPDEPDAACSLIQRIPQMDNVDALLLSEEGAYERIALEAAELMRIARFDYDGYMAKVNQWPECPAKCSVS